MGVSTNYFIGGLTDPTVHYELGGSVYFSHNASEPNYHLDTIRMHGNTLEMAFSADSSLPPPLRAAHPNYMMASFVSASGRSAASYPASPTAISASPASTTNSSRVVLLTIPRKTVLSVSFSSKPFLLLPRTRSVALFYPKCCKI